MTIEYAGMALAVAMAFMIAMIIIVVIWHGTKLAQTKIQVDARLDQDNAYRTMAEESALFQKQIAEDIADMRERVAAMEKMLREVE